MTHTCWLAIHKCVVSMESNSNAMAGLCTIHVQFVHRRRHCCAAWLVQSSTLMHRCWFHMHDRRSQWIISRHGCNSGTLSIRSFDFMHKSYVLRGYYYIPTTLQMLTMAKLCSESLSSCGRLDLKFPELGSGQISCFRTPPFAVCFSSPLFISSEHW